MKPNYPLEVKASRRRFFESLPERERRHDAAVEALKLGRGGVVYVAQVLGCDEKTIRRGKREFSQPPDLAPSRSRKKGVGGNR